MKAKQSSSNIKKPALIMGIAFVALGCTLGASSFAWFLLPSSTKQVNGMDGEATGSYFSPVNEDGKADGTKEHPYGIKNAKQLYYFNWLQDLGYFNRDEKNASGQKASDGTIDQQYYFVLMNDIDANNYVLPPAGTKDYPFVGNFDGGGHTISNLKISNSWNDLTDIPKGATQNGTMLSNAEIVGFFGIIGQYSSGASTTTDSVTTGSVNCKGSDGNATTATYTIRSVSGTGDEATTTYVNAVNDLYFDNLNVSTVADKTLAGLLAGYVNGQMQYCGVRSGYFSFGTNVGVLTDNVLGAANTNLSKYSIVGDYNSNNFSWDGRPKDGSSSTDWGGSIDMYSFGKRLSFTLGANNKYVSMGSSFLKAYQNSGKIYNLQDKGLYVTSQNKNVAFHDFTTKTGDVGYISGGATEGISYFPLNIDLELNEMSEISVTSSAATEDKVSLVGGVTSKTTKEYQNGKGENPASTNPGFITGVTTTDSGTYYNTSKYTTRYSVNKLSKISTSSNNSSGTYDSSKFVLYGFDYSKISSSNYPLYKIKDDDNSSSVTGSDCIDATSSSSNAVFHQYSKVKSNFNALMSGKSLYYSISWTDGATPSKHTTGSKVKLAGNEYDSLYGPGVDFYVKEQGYITCIAGGQYNTTSGAIFSLYQIDRSSDSCTLINTIYKNNGSLELNPASESGTLIYSAEAYHNINLSSANGAIYLEIEVPAGEYLITSTSGTKNNGLPLIYLDVGANATGGNTPTTTTIPPIDFVYYSDPANKVIKKINSADAEGNTDYIPSKLTCAIAGKPATIYFYRVLSSDGTSESTILYYVNTAGDTAATLVWTGTGASAAGSYNEYSQSEDTTSGGAN